MKLTRTSYDYQARASAFSVGAKVYPILGQTSEAGTVVAVWPAIGMVDVQHPNGVIRYPVEDVAVDAEGVVGDAAGPGEGRVPGGAPVPVSGGPPQSVSLALKVAGRYLSAIYWKARDRKFRPSRAELESGQYCCPRCKDSILRRATFRHKNGQSERLWGCPECMFLVCDDDILEVE